MPNVIPGLRQSTYHFRQTDPLGENVARQRALESMQSYEQLQSTGHMFVVTSDSGSAAVILGGEGEASSAWYPIYKVPQETCHSVRFYGILGAFQPQAEPDLGVANAHSREPMTIKAMAQALDLLTDPLRDPEVRLNFDPDDFPTF